MLDKISANLLLIWGKDEVIGNLHAWGNLGHWSLTHRSEIRRFILGHLDMSGNLMETAWQVYTSIPY